MLAVVACTCGNSESLARRVLKEGGCERWLEVPIFKGKDKVREFAFLLQGHAPQDKIDEIKHYVSDKSSYVVVVGYTPHQVEWVDIKNGDLTSMLDGKVIAREFDE